MSVISPERLMIESDYDDIKLQIVSETDQVTETQPALNLQYQAIRNIIRLNRYLCRPPA